MEPATLEVKLAELSQKIDTIYLSVEKTRKYFLYALVVSLVVFILPLIVAVFAVPSFLSSYTQSFSGASIDQLIQ